MAQRALHCLATSNFTRKFSNFVFEFGCTHADTALKVRVKCFQCLLSNQACCLGFGKNELGLDQFSQVT
ncbi:hypothetical protein AB595_10905 [Massilia sp. WF1]|nr:hypothetical protein AM586_08090 [Massilia sp. WG5]KLU36896.1 hypothetical protein AB595_10905 [Massilia sp. WF1]